MSRFVKCMLFALAVTAIPPKLTAADETVGGKRDTELEQVSAALGPKANVKELDKYWKKYSEEHQEGQRFVNYVYNRYMLRQNIGKGLVGLSSLSFVIGISMSLYVVAESKDDNTCYLAPCDESDDYLDEQVSEEEKRRLEVVRKTGLAMGITGIALLPIGISLMVSGKNGQERLSPLRVGTKTASMAPFLSIEPAISPRTASGSLSLKVSF